MYASKLGRFQSPDPTKRIGIATPQSWNKYNYTFNSPLRFVDRDGNYPTVIHDLIIRLAFPELRYSQIRAIQVGSFSVDFPKTVLARYAYQHAMRKPSETVEQAETKMRNFISENNDVAKSNNSNSENSLFYFGKASHSIMDNNSPAHRRFQIYDDTDFMACLLTRSVATCYPYYASAAEHSRDESYIFSSDLTQAVSDVRENYRKVYGDEALKRAVGIFSDATFIFNNAPINGSRNPSGVNLKNLGVVTVYADGREEYEGPLKRVR